MQANGLSNFGARNLPATKVRRRWGAPGAQRFRSLEALPAFRQGYPSQPASQPASACLLLARSPSGFSERREHNARLCSRRKPRAGQSWQASGLSRRRVAESGGSLAAAPRELFSHDGGREPAPGLFDVEADGAFPARRLVWAGYGTDKPAAAEPGRSGAERPGRHPAGSSQVSGRPLVSERVSERVSGGGQFPGALLERQRHRREATGSLSPLGTAGAGLESGVGGREDG